MKGKKLNSIYGVELTMISADVWRAEVKKHGNDVEKVIAKYTVSRVEDANGDFKGYIASVNGIPNIMVCADGNFYKYKKNGMCTQGKSKFKSGHIRVLLAGTSITLERLMMILDALYKNEIPAEFGCLEVNVMDLSGSKYTCEKLGLKQNFSPENLEWTLKDLNTAHSWTVHRINKVLGKKVKISANDMYLHTLVALEKFDEVEKYIKDNELEIE